MAAPGKHTRVGHTKKKITERKKKKTQVRIDRLCIRLRLSSAVVKPKQTDGERESPAGVD